MSEQSKIRVYLAGPMTGYPEYNYPAFHAAAEMLRAQGYDVVNPAEVNPESPPEFNSKEEFFAYWAACMRRDLVALLSCRAVFVLPGWEKSRGARLELYTATNLGMQIYELGTHGAIPHQDIIAIVVRTPSSMEVAHVG